MISTIEASPDVRAPMYLRPWMVAGLATIALSGCSSGEPGLPPSDPHATVANPHVRQDYNIQCEQEKNTLFLSCQPKATGTYKLYEGSYENPQNKPLDTVTVQNVHGTFVFAPEDVSAPHCTKGYVTLVPTGTNEQYQVYSFDICNPDK